MSIYRKIIKSAYLKSAALLNALIRPKIKKDHVVITMTFSEDVVPIIKQLKKNSVTLTVLYHSRHENLIKTSLFQDITCIPLNNKNIISHIKAIKSARVVLIDTYYLLLGSISKRKQQEVIQLWHASGALKEFGLFDHSVNQNDKTMIRQYKKVYHFTDSYITAGSNMEKIFKRSLDADDKRFIHTGLPRLNQVKKHEHTRMNDFKYTEDAPVKILFLPTYREYQLEKSELLNEEKLKNIFNEKHLQLTIKAHPSDINYVTEKRAVNSDAITLIQQADIVISDYSSLVIDALYARKPVYLYVTDEAKYHETRGLNKAYFDLPQAMKIYDDDKRINLPNEMSHQAIEKWTNYQMDDAAESIAQYIMERLK